MGELDVASGPLEGTVVEPGEVPLAIDELPLVALLGCFAEGETVVRGAEELRVKESDRIAGVVDGLSGLGADIEATPDGFVVRGDGTQQRAARSTRAATTGWRCSARSPGSPRASGVEVMGMEAAGVSYPGLRARPPGAVVVSANVYDWLLFLHVLAAFLLGITVVMYSAVALGSRAGGRAPSSPTAAGTSAASARSSSASGWRSTWTSTRSGTGGSSGRSCSGSSPRPRRDGAQAAGRR